MKLISKLTIHKMFQINQRMSRYPRHILENHFSTFLSSRQSIGKKLQVWNGQDYSKHIVTWLMFQWMGCAAGSLSPLVREYFMTIHQPNADIFLAMGFPRILTVGESLRSNSSDSRIATLGPMSTLTEVRERILSWIEWFYEDLAERNNMATWPKPYFSPIQFQDMTALTQFAIQAQQIGAISKDTISQLYGTTYEEEQQKISFEVQADDTNQQEPGTPEEPGNVPGTGVQPPEEQ